MPEFLPMQVLQITPFVNFHKESRVIRNVVYSLTLYSLAEGKRYHFWVDEDMIKGNLGILMPGDYIKVKLDKVYNTPREFILEDHTPRNMN